MTLKAVFETLVEDIKEHELFVEREFARVETAINGFKTTVTRRIDALDDRMDDFRKRYGGKP